MKSRLFTKMLSAKWSWQKQKESFLMNRIYNLNSKKHDVVHRVGLKRYCLFLVSFSKSKDKPRQVLSPSGTIAVSKVEYMVEKNSNYVAK